MRILKEYETEYKYLKQAVHTMNSIAVKYGYKPLYTIEETYLDFGQDWKWTTIVYNSGGRNSFQALYPNNWKEICENGNMEGLFELTRSQLDLLAEEEII